MNKIEFYKIFLNIINIGVYGYIKYLYEVIKVWGNKVWWRSLYLNFLYSY